MNFLLDENVDRALRPGLVRATEDAVSGTPNILVIGDPGCPPRQTPDPAILIWCEEHDYALVTNNRTSMPVHLADHLRAGRHVPGIFVLDPQATLGETIRDLALIAIGARLDEYTDRIIFLPDY